VDPAHVQQVIGELLKATGPFAPLLLFAAAVIEYVFPPFPGDLVVVFGAWYAVHGELSWPVTYAAVTAGAVLGSVIDHRVGVAVGRRLSGRWASRAGLTPEKLEQFEKSYRRWGVWLLLANRFLPGIRAFLFVAAGASGIPLRSVILFGGVSAALWNAGLLAAGATLAKNVDELVDLMRRYTVAAWITVGAGVALAVGLWLWRRGAARRAARRGAGPG
jgi:membrane-associated protein